MSLKALHLVFLTLSTAVALGFGVWAVLRYGDTPNTFYFAAAVLSFLVAAALPVYGARFLRKLRELAAP